MSRFPHRNITNATLRNAGGRYEGRIVRVVPQQVFNKWKFTREEVVPVISFEDGWEWIPNIGARAAWGPDTDRWVGHRMAIYLKPVARTEQASGGGVERLEKCVEPLEDDEA